MSQRTVTLSERQAQTLAAKMEAANRATIAAAEYFTAVCDGHDLPHGTQFMTVDTTSRELLVEVPE